MSYLSNMKMFIASLLILLPLAASAAAKPYTVTIHDPDRDIGYIVGDTIKRSIEVEVTAPYKLARGSIPAKGVAYKGIELREVRLTEKASANSTHYQLQLIYQVFTSSQNVKKAELPKLSLKLGNTGKNINVDIPAWRFRISPLAAYGEAYVEQDMSPYRGPMLVEYGYLKPLFGGFLMLTLFSVISLIYINADGAWFPGMGGPFAASSRKISGFPKGQENLRHAIESIHHAFSQTYGENLFPADVDAFLQKHPAFSGIRKEIEAFFELSNSVLYKTGAIESGHSGRPDAMHFLQDFCGLCRNCERGVA
jgi:mxaA protein